MKSCIFKTILAVPFLFFILAEIVSAAPAIDFELPTLDETTVHLSDFRGKIIILKLATTWCPTCTQQTDEIVNFSQFFSDQEIVVVDVFLQDSEAMVRDYLKGKDLPFRYMALMDDGRVRNSYNVFMIPRLLLIDREFEVRRDGNFISSKDLQKEVTLILKESR